MIKWVVRWMGFRMVRRAVAGRRGGPFLDMGLGLALMRSRSVPVVSKLLALGMGCLAVVALIALELPLEGLVALLLNLPGIELDLMVDGLEILAGPLLIGSLLIVHVAPAHIVAALRESRHSAAFAR